MAENKKSFVLYTEQQETFNQLSNEQAGMLIKHIFSYVNDDNPISDNQLINLLFIPIKQQLKRDLDKWEGKLNQKSEAGLKGAISRFKGKLNVSTDEEIEKIRAELEINLFEDAENQYIKECLKEIQHRYNKINTVDSVTTKSTVNVDVNVNEDVNENDINNKTKKILLSDLKKSDVKINYLSLIKEHSEPQIKIALMFQELFLKNIISVGGSISKIKKAKSYVWVDPIRKLVNLDKITAEQFRTVYDFLEKNDFWKPNILSTSKLREKFNELLLNANKEKNKKDGKSTGTTKATAEGIKNIINEY